MIITHFSEADSIVQDILSRMRDVELQQDRARFRTYLEKLGEYIGYEISKTLDYTSYEVTTPLGIHHSRRVKEERVMLNERGEIASASMANLFWVRGGKLRTPSRECGCRAGTVRRWVLERSGRRVEEERWKLEELNGAEEIFLTNARIGIKSVRAWKGRKLAESQLAGELAERFWKESS